MAKGENPEFIDQCYIYLRMPKDFEKKTPGASINQAVQQAKVCHQGLFKNSTFRVLRGLPCFKQTIFLPLHFS
jgi:hypothetical protein